MHAKNSVSHGGVLFHGFAIARLLEIKKLLWLRIRFTALCVNFVLLFLSRIKALTFPKISWIVVLKMTRKVSSLAKGKVLAPC